jgi:hypothetical protein
MIALEVFERMRLGQFKTALELTFPEVTGKMDWNSLKELEKPLKEVFFPKYKGEGGPGICNPEVGRYAQMAYEIQEAMQQFFALKESEGWFGIQQKFNGNILNPSGEPFPQIKGLEEMQYKDFPIPNECQEQCLGLIWDQKTSKCWPIIEENMPDLPKGERYEIHEGMTEHGYCGQPYAFVRVFKPRKP